MFEFIVMYNKMVLVWEQNWELNSVFYISELNAIP